MVIYLQGGRKTEGDLQEMARNLTIALAPDDFKPANELEPQVKLLQAPCCECACSNQSMVASAFLHRPQVHDDEVCHH